ncbi:CRISPR-associated protein Cas5 [Carnobacterium gallinarum]|uniref:CRISPR-associated protein Cas5 n=1 Tax=Carnobacterium gallinarum TaxID=2749 RepID=UPI0005578744|nr:CRISPR-associated protein Cas5 [Carnobacterium gallinarum]
MTKVLRFNLFQPVAHFRDPKVLQDDFIATLNLPAPTTIVGMLSYLCDCKFNENLEVAVIGTHEKKEVHFSRGEREDFWRKYQTYVKKKEESLQKSGTTYLHYKHNIAENRMMYSEVLRNLELTIFIKASDAVLELLLENLTNPKRYLSLGRKEDTALLVGARQVGYVKSTPAIVDIEELEMGHVSEALSKQVKLMHSYVAIDEMASAKLLASGTLFTLPYTYQDLAASKINTQKLYRNYIYIEEGVYPENCTVYCYKKNQEESEYFLWM